MSTAMVLLFKRSTWIFLASYHGLHVVLEKAMQNSFMGDGVVFGWLLNCLDWPRWAATQALGWLGFDDLGLTDLAISALPTLFWLSFWIWLNHDAEGSYVRIYMDAQHGRRAPLLENSTWSFRWKRIWGRFVLADAERLIFQRIYAELPNVWRRPFHAQMQGLNRSHRQYLNEARTRAVTAFQKVRWNGTPVPALARFPMPPDVDEFALGECVLRADDHVATVVLIVRHGELSRLAYTSTHDLADFPMAYVVDQLSLNVPSRVRATLRSTPTSARLETPIPINLDSFDDLQSPISA